MEGQGTMKVDRNVIIPKIANGDETNDPAVPAPPSTMTDDTVIMKHDWMIPLQFQSDISHIHQKAGFTQLDSSEVSATLKYITSHERQ